MLLEKWRKSKKMSRVTLTRLLELTGGKNPSQNLRKYENGESAFPSLLIPKVLEITNGEVTLDDLLNPRRGFLARREAERANQSKDNPETTHSGDEAA